MIQFTVKTVKEKPNRIVRRVQSQRAGYLFETRGRVAHLLQHGPLDRSLPDVAVVFPRALGAAGRPAGALVAWLVEVGLCHQDERLHRHQNLQKKEV